MYNMRFCASAPVKIALWCFCVRVCDLGGCVGVSSFAQQQAGHLGVSLLGRQVQRADPLLGQNVGLRSVLQQRRRDVGLVLLGGDVERSVAVLEIRGGLDAVSANRRLKQRVDPRISATAECGA